MKQLGDIVSIPQKWRDAIGIIVTIFCLSAWINTEIMTIPWWLEVEQSSFAEMMHPFFMGLRFLLEVLFPLSLFAVLLHISGAEHYIYYLCERWVKNMRGFQVKADMLSYVMMGCVSLRPTLATSIISLKEMGACRVIMQSLIEIAPPLYGGAGLLMLYNAPSPNRAVMFYGVLPAIMMAVGVIAIYHLSLIRQLYMESSKVNAVPHTVLASKEHRVREGRVNQQFASFALRILNGLIIICLSIIAGYIVHQMLYWMRIIYHENDIYLFIQLVLGAYVTLLWVASKYHVKQAKEWTDIARPHQQLKSNMGGRFYHLLPIIIFLWLCVVEQLSISHSALWGCAMSLCVLLSAEAFLSSFRQLRRLKQPNIMRELLEGAGQLRSVILMTAQRILPLALSIMGASMVLCLCYYYEIPAFFASFIEGHIGRYIAIASVISALLFVVRTPVMVQYFVITMLFQQAFHAFSSTISLYFMLFYSIVLVQFIMRVTQQRLWHATDLPYIALAASVFMAVLYEHTWLLQGVQTVEYGALIALIGVVAILLLCAGLQGFFMLPCATYQRVLLCIAAFTLLMPTLVLQLISPEYMQKITQMNVDAAKYIVYFPALCMVGFVYGTQQAKSIKNGRKQ